MDQEYLDIANSPGLFVICLVPIVIAIGQSLLFVRIGAKQAKKEGLEKGLIRKTVASSAVASVIPSIPVIISLAALMPILGRYIPWLRLSVMGSAAYESFAADITLKAFGLGGLGEAQLTPSVFVSVIWVMTIAILVSPVENILFLKSYDKKLSLYRAKGGFLAVASGALMLGMVSILFIPELLNFEHPVGILTGVVAGVSALLLDLLAKKTGVKVIRQFSFPLGMVIGMAAAVIAEH